MTRQATEDRRTTETQIRLTVNLDGQGQSRISTGIPFLNHMLTLFARHGRFDLEIAATGDLDVDAHHTVEDLGLVLGKAIKQALGDKKGITRYGFFLLPMDETLVRVVLDLSGRAWLDYHHPETSETINGLNVRLFREFFQALTNTLGLNLHIDVLRGEEAHHIIEGIFKCFARALAAAVALDPRETGIPSTKGLLE
jgi:imidazoleglycerol-phosphate dehydratase